MILFATMSGYGYSYGGERLWRPFAAFGMLFAGMLLFAARACSNELPVLGLGPAGCTA